MRYLIPAILVVLSTSVASAVDRDAKSPSSTDTPRRHKSLVIDTPNRTVEIVRNGQIIQGKLRRLDSSGVRIMASIGFGQKQLKFKPTEMTSVRVDGIEYTWNKKHRTFIKAVRNRQGALVLPLFEDTDFHRSVTLHFEDHTEWRGTLERICADQTVIVRVLNREGRLGPEIEVSPDHLYSIYLGHEVEVIRKPEPFAAREYTVHRLRFGSDNNWWGVATKYMPGVGGFASNRGDSVSILQVHDAWAETEHRALDIPYTYGPEWISKVRRRDRMNTLGRALDWWVTDATEEQKQFFTDVTKASLKAASDLYALSKEDQIGLGPPARPSDCTIRGTIIDAATKRPLSSKTRVVLYDEYIGTFVLMPIRETVTDDKGRFTFRYPPGTMKLATDKLLLFEGILKADMELAITIHSKDGHADIDIRGNGQ